MSRTDYATCEAGMWKPMHGGCPTCGPDGPCYNAAYERLIQWHKLPWWRRLLTGRPEARADWFDEPHGAGAISGEFWGMIPSGNAPATGGTFADGVEAAAKVCDAHASERRAMRDYAISIGQRKEARDYDSMGLQSSMDAAAIRALQPVAGVSAGEAMNRAELDELLTAWREALPNPASWLSRLRAILQPGAGREDGK